MVLIISENFDPSTNDVIDWLIYYSVDYYRVNVDDEVNFKVCIDYSGVFQKPQYSFQHDEKKIYLSDLTAVWYRRGGFPFTIDVSGLSFEGLGGNAPDQLKDSLRLENRALLNTFYKKLGRLKNVNILGRRETGTLNKLDVLDLACELGINIPRYIICTDKKQALDFYKSCDEKVIGKAIHENPLFYDDSNRVFTSFVERISMNDINGMADTFMPSLLQEEIVKDIEIRTFFLIDSFYSMAIFSQLDSQTEVDFRVYNDEKPNRTIPYTLPDQVEEKLLKLMNELTLETASIDIILGKDGIYYFLEANPVGQFGMTSVPCNYKLEQKIAEYLVYGKN